MSKIKTEVERMNLVREISTMKLPFYCEIKARDRSLDQLALAFRWYGQIAARLREHDTTGWRRLCKWHFGVPILRAADPDYNHACVIFNALHYEQIIFAMDYWPVTSIMSVTQMSEYLTAIQTHFGDRYGIILTGLEQGHDQYPEAAA